MNPNILSKAIAPAMLIAMSVIPGAQAASHNTNRADVSPTIQARQELKDIKELAFSIERDADRLSKLAGSNTAPQSHLAKLLALHDEVNAMGKHFLALDAKRPELTNWERQTVDSILPLIQQSVSNTEKAIKYFNANRGRLMDATYRDYASNLYQDAERIHQIVKDRMKLDGLQSEQGKIQQRLSTLD